MFLLQRRQLRGDGGIRLVGEDAATEEFASQSEKFCQTFSPPKKASASP